MVRFFESGWPFTSLGDRHGVRIEDYRDDGTYVVGAELPGMDPEKDIAITLEGDHLSIKAERTVEKHDEAHSEFSYGSFARTVRLPGAAVADKVSASYDAGILEVTVPLTELPGTKKIPVRISIPSGVTVSRLRSFGIPMLCAALSVGLTATPAEAAVALPILVAIRAAHHPTFDRVVFEFTGSLPTDRKVGYVPAVVGDPSGEPVAVVGDAFLVIRMEQATGHDDNGNVTYGPTRRSYALPNVIQVVNAGDFEGVLTFGIGLAAETPVRLSTLTNPSRVVLDIDAAFRTVTVQDHFLDEARFEANTPPFTRAVPRPVIPPATARGALQRLFAGPTEAELAQRLRLVSSDATGFTGLSIRDSIARVRLTGGCSSHGSTFTIADEIMATLKQFSSIRWVKIYDPAGTTERPDGPVDSIPECLEP